jgi:Na+/H+-dicarboxylate symporter
MKNYCRNLLGSNIINLNKLDTLHVILYISYSKYVGFVYLLAGLFFSLKMEAACSTETSVDFQELQRRYIPELRTLVNTSSSKMTFIKVLGQLLNQYFFPHNIRSNVGV